MSSRDSLTSSRVIQKRKTNYEILQLYGEGEQAFIRLQMEILKFSDDESIFAWFGNSRWDEETGLLATSLDQFKDSGHISMMVPPGKLPRPEYLFTNKGLKIEMDLYEVRVHEGTLKVVSLGTSIPYGLPSSYLQYLAPLNCTDGQAPERYIALNLVSAVASHTGDKGGYTSFHRKGCVALDRPLPETYSRIQPRTGNIYVPQALNYRSRIAPFEISIQMPRAHQRRISHI